MTSLDISKNNIRAAGGMALAEALKGSKIIKALNVADAGLCWGVEPGSTDISGIIALADAISDMGALTSLNMSANGLKGAEAGKALGDAIAANTVLKELDISGGEYKHQNCDVEFVQTFSVGLRDNGALLSLNLALNSLCGMDEYGNGTYDASGNARFYCHT
jgi:hypothetical protein